jgi:integrase
MANYFTTPDEAYGIKKGHTKIRKMILNRTNKEGLTKVYIEVRFYEYKGAGEYSDKPLRLPTRIWVSPKNWNKKKQQITGNEEDAQYKNAQINKAYSEVKNFIDSYEPSRPNQAYGEAVSLDKLEKHFPNRPENRKTLLDHIEDYYQFRKKRNTVQGTLKEFKTLKNRVKAFDEFKGKKSYLDELNTVWSDDFEEFLMNHAKNKDSKGYSSGTIEKTYTILITVLNHIYSRRGEYGVKISDRFLQRGWKRGKPSKNKANPITPKQLQALYNHTFEQKYLELTKVRFCLQCYTGVRFSDLHRITPDTIKDNKRIVITPVKTKNHDIEAVIPLNEYSDAIIKKFNYDTTSLKIANQPYNRNIEDMLKVMQEKYPDLNFKTDHRSHCGRDTFITNAVMAKVDWKTILTWVGQKSYTIMDRYIGISDDYSDSEMTKVFDVMEASTK